MGYTPGRTRRLARLLRSRPYLERAGRPATVLAAPLDLAMRLLARESWPRARRAPRLEPMAGFDAAYDRFWVRVRPQHAIVADRDAEYMNWRYAEWPSRHYDLAVLRRGDEIAATIVSYVIGDVVYIAELFALDREAFDATLVAFLRAQRRAGASAVSVILLGDVPCGSRLGAYGFRLRDVERSLMVHVPARAPLRSLVHRVDRWTLFEGDIL
jgi:hypothetical protein